MLDAVIRTNGRNTGIGHSIITDSAVQCLLLVGGEIFSREETKLSHPPQAMTLRGRP